MKQRSKIQEAQLENLKDALDKISFCSTVRLPTKISKDFMKDFKIWVKSKETFNKEETSLLLSGLSQYKKILQSNSIPNIQKILSKFYKISKCILVKDFSDKQSTDESKKIPEQIIYIIIDFLSVSFRKSKQSEVDWKIWNDLFSVYLVNDNYIRTLLILIISYLNKEHNSIINEVWYDYICLNLFDKIDVSYSSLIIDYLLSSVEEHIIDPLKPETWEKTLKLLNLCYINEPVKMEKALSMLIKTEIVQTSPDGDDNFPSSYFLLHYECNIDDNNLYKLNRFKEEDFKFRLLSLLLLIVFFAFKNYDDKELVKSSLLRFRFIANKFFIFEDGKDILNFLNFFFENNPDLKEYNDALFVILILFFDLGVVEKNVWDFWKPFIEVSYDETLSLFSVFVSHLASVFAVIFYDIDKEKCKGIPLMNSLATEPIVFMKQQKMKSGLNMKYRINIMNMDSNNYSKQKALRFLEQIFNLFPDSIQLYRILIDILAEIESLIPSSIKISKNFLNDTFLFTIDENYQFVPPKDYTFQKQLFFDFHDNDKNKKEKMFDIVMIWESVASEHFYLLSKEQVLVWYSMFIWLCCNDNYYKAIAFLLNTKYDLKIALLIPFISYIFIVTNDQVFKNQFQDISNKFLSILLSCFSISYELKTANYSDYIINILSYYKNTPIAQFVLEKLNQNNQIDLFSLRLNLIDYFYRIINIFKDKSFFYEQYMLFGIIMFSNDIEAKNKFKCNKMFETIHLLKPSEIIALNLLITEKEKIEKMFSTFSSDILEYIFNELNSKEIDSLCYYFLSKTAFITLLIYPNVKKQFLELLSQHESLISNNHEKLTMLSKTINIFFSSLCMEGNKKFPDLECDDLILFQKKTGFSLIRSNEDHFNVITRHIRNTSEFRLQQIQSKETQKEETKMEISFAPIQEEEQIIFKEKIEVPSKLIKCTPNQIRPGRPCKNLKFQDLSKINTENPKKMSNIDNIDNVHNSIFLLFFLLNMENDVYPTNTHLINIDKKYISQFNRVAISPEKRESKIGIVYIQKEQVNQSEILKNPITSTSPYFQAFLLSIGECVNLEKFNGYSGKLDMNHFANGKHSIYYENYTNKVMFHVAPMMPSVIDDDQQIMKKRHIGNDNVHIVWTENPQKYDTSTIKSSFNDAHVIIYPIKERLYRVQVSRKKESYNFGPLGEKEVILSPDPLAFLTRMTAINADVVVRSQFNNDLGKEMFYDMVSDLENLKCDIKYL